MLIERDLIRFTDFSDPAQKRLIERQTLRMRSKQLNLIDDEHGLFLNVGWVNSFIVSPTL